MSQHELLDWSILPKANKVKNFSVLKPRTEVDTINCSLMFTAIDRDRITSRLIYEITRYFVPRCFDLLDVESFYVTAVINHTRPGTRPSAQKSLVKT